MDDLQKASDVLAATQKVVDEKATHFIIELIKEGKSAEFIVERLVANGYSYDESYAATHHIFNRVAEAQQKKGKSNAGVDIGLGLLILAIGIGVTVGSGHIIAYGAIIVGAIKLIRGIANLGS